MTSRSRRVQYHTVCSHPDTSHFPCVRKSKSNWTRWKRWTSYQRLMGPRIGALEWWLCRKSQETPESALTSRHSTTTSCVRCTPVEETLAQVTGATVFSKLDANSGYWQIPLSESSKHLTTFVTPSGRYCFNRLPFGISSASEIFHKHMSRILAGCKGVLVHHNDVLVYGATQQEHDANLLAALKRLEKANVTLNPDKCKFSRTSIDFLGQIVDKNGIRPDPAKTQAVLEMEPPQSVSNLRRFMGMVNQLGKFSPRLAELS